MSTTTGRKVIFILDATSDEKVNEIAEQMSREYGVPVSRSAAVRRLIELFSTPKCSDSRTTTTTTDKSAA